VREQRSISVLDSKVQVLVLASTINCPKCGRPNRMSARFCGKCGNPLVFSCPFCWSENLPSEVYCLNCGQLMRGIPDTHPRDVISLVEQVSEQWGSSQTRALFPRTPQLSESMQKELASLLAPNETPMWSFVAPQNEWFRRTSAGYSLYILDNDMLLRDGLLIAIPTRFIYYQPAAPKKRGLFRSEPGSPSIHIDYPYSAINGISYGPSLPISEETLKAILAEYPSSYQPPIWQLKDATTSSGWEISLHMDRYLRLMSLPFSGMGMYAIRFWESLLRATLGVSRSDLDYTPWRTPA
jgi:hypothetical protein